MTAERSEQMTERIDHAQTAGGYGSQAGVGVNLKAGAWLERLRKAGLVRDVSMTVGLSLWTVTEAARKALAQQSEGQGS